MFNDTDSQEVAEQKAKQLGAVSVGKSFYPPKTGTSPSVFAHYYFDADGNEVAHYIPDLNSFAQMNPPRVWAQSFINKLIIRKI